MRGHFRGGMGGMRSMRPLGRRGGFGAGPMMGPGGMLLGMGLGMGLGRAMAPRPAPLVDEAREDLARANQYMDSGEPLEAAEIFARIAAQAAQEGALLRASHLSARAAQAYLQADRIDLAQEAFRQSVGLSLRGGDLAQATHLMRDAVSSLETQGHHQEAEALRTEFSEQLARMGLQLADSGPATSHREASARLPSTCPACGGPVRPDEVEWVDDVSVVCSYCGTVIKAQ
jgi:hypothetical protein